MQYGYVLWIEYVCFCIVCECFEGGVVFLLCGVVGVLFVCQQFDLCGFMFVQFGVVLVCVVGSSVVLYDGGWLVGWCVWVVGVVGLCGGVVVQYCVFGKCQCFLQQCFVYVKYFGFVIQWWFLFWALCIDVDEVVGLIGGYFVCIDFLCDVVVDQEVCLCGVVECVL